MDRIAVLGVGHLAEALVEGMLRAGLRAGQLILSRRGHGPELAQRHGLELAADNRQLVENAGIVLLTVRPGDALNALAGLPWRPDHVVVSACAGVTLADLREAAAPAQVTRVMPLTASMLGASPTTVYPDLPQARAVLDLLGPVIPLAQESEFEVATVSAAIYGWAQTLIGLGVNWSASKGLEPGSARLLVAATFVAAGRMIAERPEPMDALIRSLATPGGITERGLHVLADHGMAEGWTEACEAVLEKLTKGSSRSMG